ncbi:helicase-related protein [Methanobrevibacter sp.]|uniref:helicase-related protein n=1 Tax=Methanobrevibacter sp. TaxID=66852 RepID=UPI00386C5ABE
MTDNSFKILDNKNNFVFKELENSIKKGSKLSVISAYFSMYAYDYLKKNLDKIDNMRFIYTKPSFLRDNIKESREYYIDNNSIFGNEYEIKLRNEMTQGSISKECAEWIKNKVDIKSFKIPNEAQPRMICVDNGNDSSIAINGSVDFTTAGLGITDSNRQDMNQCAFGQAFTQMSSMTFEAFWNNSELLEDVKDEVLAQMQTMHKENPAEFIYFLSLYNIFSNDLDSLDEDKIVRKGNDLKDSQIWNKLYKFQKDAVIGIIDKIEKYNGCILADSVGLGKTFTALAVIKYYESRNDRVLVLTPKKLSDNWIIYTQNDMRNIFLDDRFNYDVLNHTDLSREGGLSNGINLSTINWGNYDLVVIDESHNFRNNPSFKGRITRYQKLMNEIIKGGHKTRVLMLSATPVNNKMNDIKNQISFITEDDDNALVDVGIKSISETLRKAQGSFNQWTKLPEIERTGASFVDLVDLEYFKLLDTLTIARSRRHIEKYYDLSEIGHFPERKTPINIKSDIDLKGEFPSIGDINKEISRLKLAIYTPMNYIDDDETLKKYEDKYSTIGKGGAVFKQSAKDNALVGLMTINLLKRMESSIESFRLTTKKLLDNINNILDKIDDVNFDPNIDIDLIDPDEDEYENLLFGKKRKILLQDMDLVQWKQHLNMDKEKLQHLLDESKVITPDRDAKLRDLKDRISQKITNPINSDNKKVVVFTAFADTAEYLYENIHKWALTEFNVHSALITGKGTNQTTLKSVKNKQDLNDLLTNFSPISKERYKINPKATDEINLLICTDCISEGQNLQDCDYLINYDIHWNPVRIIQRFGRIDRIGSKNDEIQLVNFWPNLELNDYINLEARVKDRMIMVDVSATGEENPISKNQTMNDLEYRKKQLEELQDRVLDLEDISNSISITDLTFNDFKTELMDYMNEHLEELEKAPAGIYSIVNIPEDLKDEIEPGVIFLLKQVSGSTESHEKNPLTPYYLVYISELGEVKFSYIHSKKVLDNYQKLCVGKKGIFPDLIQKFNEKTNDGKDMKKYSELLVETIEDILGKKQDVGIDSLFSGEDFTTLEKMDIDGLDEFELITFLIMN